MAMMLAKHIGFSMWWMLVGHHWFASTKTKTAMTRINLCVACSIKWCRSQGRKKQKTWVVYTPQAMQQQVFKASMHSRKRSMHYAGDITGMALLQQFKWTRNTTKSTMWCDHGGIPQVMQKHLKALKKTSSLCIRWQPSMQQFNQTKKLKQWLKQTKKNWNNNQPVWHECIPFA